MTNRNKTVGIVTGAGSGMGRETALLAASRGAAIYALDIDLAAVTETSRLTGTDDADIFPIQCDVGDEASVSSALSPIFSSEAPLHFLVNGAGIEGSGAGIPEITLSHWNRILGINLTGTFLLMREVLPLMRAQGFGAVVNMGSVAAMVGWAELGAYSTTKHAIVGLTRSAVAEFAPYGVRINAICPGPIDTPLQERAEAAAKDPAEFRSRQEKSIPQGRYGTSREVAELILFLVSDRSEYVNGAIIPIDGGMTATR